MVISVNKPTFILPFPKWDITSDQNGYQDISTQYPGSRYAQF